MSNRQETFNPDIIAPLVLSRADRRRALLREIKSNRYIYLLMVPGLLFYAVFAYGPMPGLVLAFKNYVFSQGIFGSPWVGLENFRSVFAEPNFIRAFRNTVIISFGKILFNFPVPIILAILINELRMRGYKRVLQTVYTLPHFLSWVVIAGIVVNIFSSRGAMNNLLMSFGLERRAFLADTNLFRPILYFFEAWKESGWGAIIYLATITTIDPGIYESAEIDGASRLQQIWHITFPSILSIITLLLILQIGQVMNAGFMQILNLYNPTVYQVGDIIDTYVYRITFERPPDFGYSTAVGFFKAVLNFVLVVVADRTAKAAGQSGIF